AADTKGAVGAIAAIKADQDNILPANLTGSTIKVALVSKVQEVSMADLRRVAAALQKQVARDVKPIWNVDATVEPFSSMESVPKGYWPITIQQDIGFAGASGVHLDNKGDPF